MTRDDVIDLLTLAAVYDQRTGGESDVRGWLAVAQLERWTAPAAQRVLVEHYSRGADRPRLTPAAISDGIRAARHKAADSFVAPEVPWDMPGRDYPAWYRTQRDAHVDRVLGRWAVGEPLPEPSAAAELDRATALPIGSAPPELQQQITHDMALAGRERPIPRRPSRLPHLAPADPDRLERARAELAAIRPAIDQPSEGEQSCAT